MEFCLGQSQWTYKGDQEEAFNNYSECLAKSIVAEQLFRAEINRPKPGWYRVASDEDDE